MVASISLAHEGLLGNCNILLLGVRNFNREAFTADLFCSRCGAESRQDRFHVPVTGYHRVGILCLARFRQLLRYRERWPGQRLDLFVLGHRFGERVESARKG